MSKVILTQEQAKIIEETKFALAGFSNKMLVRCLNGEYEVEPEYSGEEKRRRWWNDRDRDVWELHEGDVIKAKEDGLAFDVSSLNEVYLTELSTDELDERYLVVCLAENREDVKEDE